MKKFFKSKYRIVTDNFCGYEVQKKEWFMPFWRGCFVNGLFSNTHRTIEEARNFAKKGNIVEYIS